MKTEWKVIEKSDNVSVTQGENTLAVMAETQKWAHIYLTTNVFECKENSIYKIDVDYTSDECDFRMLVQFFKKEDLEYYAPPMHYNGGSSIPEAHYGYRYYIKNGDEICVPDGTDCFTVDVVVCTEKSTAIELGDVNYEYVKPYQPKNVCLCAICDTIIPSSALTSQITLVEEYCRKIDEIVEKEHPDIITLTEHFHGIGVRGLTLKNKFLTNDSEILKMISDKAKQHGIYICGNYHILEDGCRYNRTILFDRHGKNIAQYDKNHLTIMEYEMGIKRGNGIVCVDTDIGRIGFETCWDMFFPEISRSYMKEKCDIILCPTRGNARYQNNAASFTSGTYIVHAAYDDIRTCIYDKEGDVLDTAGERHYTVATVDVNKPIWHKRISVGLYYGISRDVYLNESRPETYVKLCEK